MKQVWAVLRALALAVAIFGLVAVALILSQRPGVSGGPSLQFDVLSGVDHAPAPVATIPARDGTALALRRHGAGRGDAPLLVLVHGSGAHGASYDRLGAELARRGAADVVVPDLRGHGASGGARGDVDHIGQLEDDLADLIAAERKPGQAVVLAGHSSGGGLVIRMAGGAQGDLIDGAVLLAPFLKYNAPTMRDNSGGWAHPATRRIIGLTMLNAAGITALNGLPVIAFNVPDNWQDIGLVDRYTWRMNVSFAPRSDYFADLAALPDSLLVVGAQDEAFRADAFASVMADAGAPVAVEILPGVGHLDLVLSDRTVDLMAAYLAGF